MASFDVDNLVEPDFDGPAQPNVTTPFVIAENISSGALTVTLDDTDMPYGRPREVVGFRSGGKVRIAQGGIYNPGSDRVVLQMMVVEQNRLTIKGAFRDRIRAGAQKQQGGQRPNHARAMRDRLESIRARANPLKITWDGQERQGVLEEANFDEEGPNDIAYELTFFIATPPTGQEVETTSPTPPTPSLEDLRSFMEDQHAQQRAALIALLVNASIVAGVSNAMGYTATATEALGTATTALERQTQNSPQQLFAKVNAVNSLGAAVQTQVESLKDVGLDTLRADVAMRRKDADSLTSWWKWQADTQLEVDQLFDAMRQIRQQANEQVRKATRLYRVQDGDTLESIALSVLGSRARASELGIRPDQLVPGAYVRVPR